MGGAPGQQPMPGAAPPQGAPPPHAVGAGAPPPGDTAGGGTMQVAAAVVQALSQLPPQLLQAIGGALAQGVPPKDIFQQMLASQAGAAEQGTAA